MHVCISFSCEKECDDLSRINSGIILSHLTTCFSSELILLIHGSGDGGGGVYGGGGGWVRPGVVITSACFLYYELINLRKENYLIKGTL